MVRTLQKNRINALGAVFFLSLLQLAACSSSGEKTSWNPFSKKEESNGLGVRRAPKENAYYAGVPVRQGASLTGVPAMAMQQQMPYPQGSGEGAMPYGAAPYANAPMAAPVPYGNGGAGVPPVYNPAYPAPQAPVSRPVTLSMQNGAMPDGNRAVPYSPYGSNAVSEGKKGVAPEESPSYFQRMKSAFHKEEAAPVSGITPVMPITSTASALPSSLPPKQVTKTLAAPVAVKPLPKPMPLPAKTSVAVVAAHPVVKKQEKQVAEVKHVKKTADINEAKHPKKAVVSSSEAHVVSAAEKKKLAHEAAIVKKQKVVAKAPAAVAVLPSRKEFPSLSTVPVKPARLNKPDELKTEQDELLEMQRKMKQEKKQEDNSSTSPTAVSVLPAPTSDKLVVPPVLQAPVVAAAPAKMPQQAKPEEASNSVPLPMPMPSPALPKMVTPPALPAVEEPVLAPVQTLPALPSPARAVPSQPFPPSSAVDRPRKAAVMTSAAPSSDDDVREYR